MIIILGAEATADITKPIRGFVEPFSIVLCHQKLELFVCYEFWGLYSMALKKMTKNLLLKQTQDKYMGIFVAIFW